MKIDKIVKNVTYQIELTESEKVYICAFLSTAFVFGDVKASIITEKGCGEKCIETVKEFMALIGDTKADEVENQKYDYYDPKTGLEWKSRPDKDMDWYEATCWTANFGEDWRLPSIKELDGLYKEGLGEHNLPPGLETGDYGFLGLWSWETKEWWSSKCFNFYTGKYDSGCRKNPDGYSAFAVRSRA